MTVVDAQPAARELFLLTNRGEYLKNEVLRRTCPRYFTSQITVLAGAGH